MLVYRLEDTKELPLHWAYQDAWDEDNGEYRDNRNPGFQVWAELHRVVAVAAGEAIADGDYPSTEYPFLLLIQVDPSNLEEGADEWFAVRCEHVESVKAVETSRLIDWAKAKCQSEDFEVWCANSESEISEWLHRNAMKVSPKFVETLENPYHDLPSLRKFKNP